MKFGALLSELQDEFIVVQNIIRYGNYLTKQNEKKCYDCVVWWCSNSLYLQ
jgi:hypothetical protein